MLKSILATYILLISNGIDAQHKKSILPHIQDGFTLSGAVYLLDTYEKVTYGTVALYKDGLLVTGVDTDFRGKFTLSNIPAGIYELESNYLSCLPNRIKSIVVHRDIIDIIFIMKINKNNVPNFFCGEYTNPLIDLDNTTSGTIFTNKNGWVH